MKAQADLIKGLKTHANDPFLNVATVAAALGRSHQTISRWIELGKLAATPWPSGGFKIRRSELERILNTQFESE
jgi:predicted site-specific integrase-resolvase